MRRSPIAGPMRAAQVVLVVVSLLVLGGTGYAWSTLHDLTDGLTRADVIGAGESSPLDEQNILLVGLDTRTDAQGNPLPADVLKQLHAGGADDGGDTTDTMIVVHLPAGGGQATAISIPRDSYVRVAGDYGKHKINSAYTYGQTEAKNSLGAKGESGAQLETDAAQAGAKTAIETVQEFTGLTITHYAAVNLAGFYSVSQAVGGVPVCLTETVQDPYSGAHFPAGNQTVAGAKALQFVRQRHGLPNGDLDRIKRQQAFMASMAKTILSAGTLADPGKLNDLIDAVKKAVVVDADWDILGFAQQLHGISAGAIRFVTVPVVNISLKTPSDGDAVEVDPDQVQQFVREQTGGAPESQPNSPSSGSRDPALSSYVVDVRNSSGGDGLAGRAADKLSAAGYGRGSVDNGTTRKSSIVYYGHAQRTAATKIADALGGMPVASDSSLPENHFRVYLGKDYEDGSGGSNGDGSGESSGDDSAVHPSAFTAPAQAQTPPPITAGGVTCVN
ncbi:LCP family protein [Amycolatopsis jiangsuensis]|uniref:LCP family protein required for cell wall assembly n=1 Tax=Amycolatopsis jiangsuensis TaxID=1181879 RepID=A0A840J3V7_9PSEU|nr:LCP family protein [Amycolatopsis jiangsuensis]MBB4688409.1 LCP family protein required for cell wall assembly [Amycolatopsis jiangsuensis]